MTLNWKKVRKVIFLFLGIVILIFVVLYFYSQYWFNKKYVPSENQYTHRVAYINPETASLSEGFEICGGHIFDYYNPERATYSAGKNGLRKYILDNYKNKGYTDSGYLNIRFVINCKGEAGRYIAHENDLNLDPKNFTPELKDQLFELTTQLKKWNPNVIRGEVRDSYMYISYRIENGEIVEILP